MTTAPTPRCPGFVHLVNAFFWIVVDTATYIGWVKLGIRLLSKHVFLVAFNSLGRNIHCKMNYFICGEAPCRHLGAEIRHTLKTQ